MSKKKLSKLLALYLPYMVIGLVATNLGEAWRLAVGKELGDKIVSLMGTIPAAFANPLPSLHPLDMLVGLCCGAGMRLAVYLKRKNAKKYRHGMEYGSARWGGPKDIEPFMAPKFEDNIILTKTERLMMSNRPIIDQETYDNVQRIRAGVRRYPDGWGEAHPLGGLLYCADCGSPMYVNRTGNGKRVANFSCSGYGKIPVGSKCSSGHRVNADSVMALIQETLREIVRFSKEDEEEFVRIVKAEAENQQSSEIKGQKTRLAACKKRLDELETLICKIYEDNALGKLPDKRYQILDAQYAKEQESLEAEAASLQKAVDEYESGQKSADKFIALVKKYQNFEKLDTVMLNEFIYKIFVHERDYKGVANSPQTIEIYFNFIGKFGTQEVNQPTEEERAEIAEKERLRKKRHEAYLRRKANGWQNAYYQKHKAAKKAAIDAKKEAIRAEDQANGVYYLPNQKGESA